jgi:hypothetical protein
VMGLDIATIDEIRAAYDWVSNGRTSSLASVP